MKNKEFFYRQYDKINWENQEKTKINFSVNEYIIKNILDTRKDDTFSLFDMGFGIGFFMRMVGKGLSKKYKNLIIDGCEPSKKNFLFMSKAKNRLPKNVSVNISNDSFLTYKNLTHYDFVTSIYVFPHFVSEELGEVARKVKSMLKEKGKFVLVVANQKYIHDKLLSKKDLFLEENVVIFNNKKYSEVLHYSDIPKIGKVIDYNREESLYEDLFNSIGLKLISKDNLNDNSFICTIFVFEKP